MSKIPFPIGLKLWSTNSNYIESAKQLFDQGFYDYIELYTVPGSFNDYSSLWKELSIPIEIHGPHFKHGMNLSLKENRQTNLNLMDEVFKFVNKFDSSSIILHPGIKGDIYEVIYQLNKLNDKRITIENMPYLALDGKTPCVGSRIEEMKIIISETGVPFCLDIGHATYAANYHKLDQMTSIKMFLELEPSRIHFMDGEWDGLYDSHMNLSKGSFPLRDIFSLISKKNIPVSLETGKKSLTNLDDFRRDVLFINNFSRHN